MGTSKKNEEEKRRGLDKRTPAQAAFEKMQEKRVSRLGTPRSVRLGFSEWVLRNGRETRNPDAQDAWRRASREDLNSGERMLCEKSPLLGEL